MSKSKKQEIKNSYSVDRRDSGYYITKHVIKDGSIIESVKVSEPDVLVICMATLERFIRKDQGL